MTEQEDASERWYEAQGSEQLQEFFDALWTELELFHIATRTKTGSAPTSIAFGSLSRSAETGTA
jgi:hypothetical protein